MITPDEITRKAAQRYVDFLRAWILGQSFFPLVFPVGARPGEYAELRAAVQFLLEQSKERRGYGYSVVSRPQRTHRHGDQTLPQKIIIETERDFLRLLGKEEEFAGFREDIALIRSQHPGLLDWVTHDPVPVLRHRGEWQQLLAVCSYFLEHPRPDRYLRELPIPLPTKFIEGRRELIEKLLSQLLPADAIWPGGTTFEQRFGIREAEPWIQIRFLDNQLAALYRLELTEIAVPRSQLPALNLAGQRCLIVENHKTFLTLPPLATTVAFFGKGFMVSAFRRIPWLAQCPLYYWGDLDAYGFQILSRLRGIFPHTVAVMMDSETLHRFADFWVSAPPFREALSLPHLTRDEHALFVRLAEEHICLEQEHIAHSYAVERLARLEGSHC